MRKDEFQGRRILITGASSGIGRAAAKLFAARGAEVLLAARRADELESACEEIRAEGGVAEAWPVDLADLDAAAELVDRVLERHGHIDVLVNNAARSIRRPVRKAVDRMHDYQRTMQINYFAPVQLILKLLPNMLEADDGHIINISTWGTLAPSPSFSAYIGSKSALDGFSRALGAELTGTGVALSTVHYPLVHTPMSAPTKHYSKVPGMTPEQAAVWILKAVRSRKPQIAPGFSKITGANMILFPKISQAIAGRINF